MSRRRAYLLVDRDLNGTAFLRRLDEAGHDVLTTETCGLSSRASDEHVLARATEIGRLVVTRNSRHFRALHAQWQKQRWQHAGILELPASTIPLAEMVSAIGRVVGRYRRRELRGKLLRLAAFLRRRR